MAGCVDEQYWDIRRSLNSCSCNGIGKQSLDCESVCNLASSAAAGHGAKRHVSAFSSVAVCRTKFTCQFSLHDMLDENCRV